jgi:hypothetical protein
MKILNFKHMVLFLEQYDNGSTAFCDSSILYVVLVVSCLILIEIDLHVAQK